MSRCKYRCDVVNRRQQELRNQSASAYIIHGLDIHPDDLPLQSSHYLIILFVKESPATAETYGKIRAPQNYFNATMTYKRTSRYVFPYGAFEQRTPTDRADSIITQEELLTALTKKTKGSLIFVSHCRTISKREDVIRMLGRYTQITVRGKCERQLSMNASLGSAFCKSDCGDYDLIATHRFYIAFENSVCDEYITEKFYRRISELLVPVVMERKIYTDIGIPSDSFIAVDDFDSLGKLGEYLDYLRKNDTAYLRYFAWTQHYRKPITYQSNALCNLCEDIYNGKRIIASDINKSFSTNDCH